MTVDYYEIRDCVVGQRGSRTVLAAPPPEETGISPEALIQHGFLKEADGRWYHELTAPELQLLQSSCGNVKVSFGGETPPQEKLQPVLLPPEEQPADAPAANYLAGGSLLSLLLSLIPPYSFRPAFLILRGLLIVAGWVLLITAHVRYPKNTFAKVLMAVNVVLVTLLFIAFIATAACGALAVFSCNRCSEEYP